MNWFKSVRNAITCSASVALWVEWPVRSGRWHEKRIEEK